MITIDLSANTVLVTGATSPIGSAIAKRFAEAGANVVVHARSDRQVADELARSLPGPGTHSGVIGELLDGAAVTALFDSIDKLHMLINNAGAYPPTPLTSTPASQWRHVVTTNLESTMLCMQAAAQRMPAGSSIINIASLSAHRPAAEQSAYNAAKAAVLSLTQSAAVEFAPRGIRVNSLSPGLIHRDGIEEQWPDGVQRWRATAPLVRLGTGLDVANACVFLASPLAEWITGTDLLVDGGAAATPAF
jgi:NAD(P)-dependent dehydrogenase (short-subunit alcohol dehydrogenase family)